MRHMREFREVCNEFVNRYVNIEQFSIWHNRHAYNRRKYVIQKVIKDWMPWFVWFFAVYSALGLVRFRRCLISFDPLFMQASRLFQAHQFFQFLRAKLVVERPVGMWRERCFYALRDETIRHMRIWGSAIMLACWLMLFIGIVWVRNHRISPNRTYAYYSFCLIEQTQMYEAVDDSNGRDLTF